jgi:DNA polymerase
MLRMCKPKPDGAYRDSPELRERLGKYCGTDVEAECCIDGAVPQLTPLQKRTWLLDQKINARGVKIDVRFATRALALAEAANTAAAKEMRKLTKGAVEKPSQVARIVKWLADRGIPCASLGKGVIEDVLITAEVLDDETALKVINLRRATAKSSVAKYKAMLASVCKDDRVRGTLRYHGASTGRWSGQLIQPQNFPRVYDEDVPLVLALHDILAKGASYSEACLWFDNPLDVLSKALRSAIIADDGHRLIGGDFSNIEGRVNAWLAGEKWKVKAFADFDMGIGTDLYVLAYSKAFDVPPEQVTRDLRQRGKVMELSMGYQGGKRAFQKMAANYGLMVSDETAETLKVAWREAHPAIRNSWYELQDAGIEAVRYKGATVPCLGGRIKYKVERDILWCRLPSGRCLAYVHPWITNQVFINEDGEEEVTERPQVAFMGVDSTTKRWCKQRLYGGLQCENVVQAIAYDLLVEGMFRIEDAGYPIVLTVHDEILSEVPAGQGSVEDFERLMAPKVEWAEGLPVAVGAWEGTRYAK